MKILNETFKSLFPNKHEQIKLVNETILVFAESVNDKSMDKFHSYISILFQQQYTVQQIDEAFSSFYELEQDLTTLKYFSPIFCKTPSIDENGVLHIIGFYPTQPQQFSFELEYIYEGLHWKLLSFYGNINEITYPPLSLPSEAEQVKLVNESILIFAESVNKKCMDKFHSYISILFQQQYTVQQVDEAFSSFYELDQDLTVLTRISPIFNNPPSIDDKGSLLITGFYPTKPKQAHFELKYLYEGQSWKLLKFSIDIK